MTNQSPGDPQNPIPERRRRPATGVTFDEMIAIIVAFSAIGAILFWSMGGRNSKLARNFGLGGNSGIFATGNTPLGSGKASSRKRDLIVARNQELEAENRQLLAQLKKQDEPVVYIPPNKTAKLPPRVAEKSKSVTLNSGAKLVPLAGVAALPQLNNRPPKKAAPSTEVEPSKEPAPVPLPVETEKPKPQAAQPKPNEMPRDVAPDYWAFPFVKQMRDKNLVPELARNQEFEPDALITRASMATLVSQAFDGKPANENTKEFTDISNQNEIAKDIDKAVSTGFMQGYSEDEFKPLENIPRYQVLVTLATGLGLKPSQDADKILQKFGDSSQMPDWAKQQVAAATEAGLVVNPPGTDASSLAPERSATRGEVAAMIHQALVKTQKLKPLNSEYIVKP